MCGVGDEILEIGQGLFLQQQRAISFHMPGGARYTRRKKKDLGVSKPFSGGKPFFFFFCFLAFSSSLDFLFFEKLFVPVCCVRALRTTPACPLVPLHRGSSSLRCPSQQGEAMAGTQRYAGCRFRSFLYRNAPVACIKESSMSSRERCDVCDDSL